MRRASIATPIVLVHGYGSSSACWFRVERSLRRVGFSTIRTMTYRPAASDIPTLAARLVRFTRALTVATGTARVHLVGHCLGGLIIRYAVGVLELGLLVDTAITVATPHRGCRSAWFGSDPSLRSAGPL